MVARRMPREQFHLFTSVLIPRDAPSFIATLQPLAGVQLPDKHNFLSLRPGLTVRQSRKDGQGSTDAEASLDLKWRPRAELVIDATLNPDFSQVALDVPQLAGNTRFALSLAEKRPFFFESADLLRTPTEALYTRSTRSRAAACAPLGAAWNGRGTGVRHPRPGWRLRAAARSLRHRLAPHTGFDSPRCCAARRPGAGLRRRLAARRYDGGRGDNAVIGSDVAWQISDQWRLRGQWLHSRTTALQDAGTGQLALAPARDGGRARLNLVRQTGAGENSFGIDDIATGFRHDTGFVNRPACAS